jgi:hypothetical protein
MTLPKEEMAQRDHAILATLRSDGRGDKAQLAPSGPPRAAVLRTAQTAVAGMLPAGVVEAKRVAARASDRVRPQAGVDECRPHRSTVGSGNGGRAKGAARVRADPGGVGGRHGATGITWAPGY